MIDFLNNVGNNHIYQVKDFADRFPEWHFIRSELIVRGCYNEKDGLFGIDSSVPVDYLREYYEDLLCELNQRSRERRQIRFHRYWQDAWIALSVILSLTALILSLKR